MTAIKGKEADFPLFTMIHKIAFEGEPAASLVKIAPTKYY